MKSKDLEQLLGRLDERTQAIHEKLTSLDSYIQAVDHKVQQAASQLASAKWHDWAIKGGIVGLLALLLERISALFRG